jgi:hypothetical protein
MKTSYEYFTAGMLCVIFGEVAINNVIGLISLAAGVIFIVISIFKD